MFISLVLTIFQLVEMHCGVAFSVKNECYLTIWLKEGILPWCHLWCLKLASTQ